MSFSDLSTFWGLFSLPSVNVSVVGPNQQSNPGDEASLDIQTITGINQGTQTQFTYTDGLHGGQEVRSAPPELVCLVCFKSARVFFLAAVSGLAAGDCRAARAAAGALCQLRV